MPSADQVPVKSPHSTMHWHMWVVLIAGSTGSALRAVRPPNLHITPDDSQRDLYYAASATGSLYRSPLAIMAQAILAILLASATAATFVGRRANNAVSQGRLLGAVDFGVTDHGQRAGGEQTTQVAIALLADTAELVLAAARVLLRHEPDPGREVSS